VTVIFLPSHVTHVNFYDTVFFAGNGARFHTVQAMKVVSDRQTRELSEKQLKETELSRVKINKEDIDLLVSRQNTLFTLDCV